MKRTTPTKSKSQSAPTNNAGTDLYAYSVALARATLSAKMGMQYDDTRNLYQALGYKTVLTYADFVAQFIRQDIAKAIIERPVKVSWSGPLAIIESREGEETGLEKAWIQLERELKLKSTFIRLDKLTGLGRWGVLLLGFSDITKLEDFRTPVKKKTGLKLAYCKPLGESSAKIYSWEKDPKNPRYGLPLLYDIALADPTGSLSQNLQVHYSRVLHVVEGGVESDVEGTPRLEAVYNRLQDLEKLIGGSAEMFWRGARPGYAADVDKEYSMGDTEKAALKDQIDEYENNLRRILVNQGIKLSSLETQISDPKNHVDVQLQMISAVTGIPKRILSGSERGELASSQDANEWVAFVQNRREEYVEPCIIRPFVDKMIELNILPTPSEGYEIEWADLFAISEKDKAEIGRIRATALREYFVNPLTPEVVPPQAFYEFFLGFSRQQIELINQIERDDLIRSIKEEDAEFQMELKNGNPSIVFPEIDEEAAPTADKKTK